MKSEIEKEFKMLLKKQQFETLRKIFSARHFIKQVNHYYDFIETPMYQFKMGMRIRQTKQSYEFTCKVKQPDGSSQEWNLPVTTNSLKTFEHPEIQEFFQRYPLHGPIKKTGKCTTWRYTVLFNEGILCLDKNHYGKITDYELEFELYPHADPIKARLTLNSILSAVQLDYLPNHRSKLQRCIEEQIHHN